MPTLNNADDATQIQALLNATLQSIFDALRNVPRDGSVVLLAIDPRSSVVLPAFTEEERASFGTMPGVHSLPVVSLTRALKSRKGMGETFERILASEREPGSVLFVGLTGQVIVCRDLTVGDQQGLLLAQRKPPTDGIVFHSNARAALLTLMTAPETAFPEQHRPLLARYQRLARAVEAAEVARPHPRSMQDVLYERFEGATLEQAFSTAATQGEQVLYDALTRCVAAHEASARP